MINKSLVNSSILPLPPPLPDKISIKKDEKKINELGFLKLENLFKNNLSSSEKVFYICNEIESVLQKGPTCGLVTLLMAKKLIDEDCSVDLDFLLKKAIELKLTLKGEMFSAYNLELLAKKVLSLKATTKNDLKQNKEEIIENLIIKNTILIPYDTDSNHEPCLKQGEKAHWCIVLGFAFSLNIENMKLNYNFVDKLELKENFINLKNLSLNEIKSLIENCSKLYLICKQGKSKYFKLFDFNKLVESNQNLFNISRDKDCSEYLIPECGLKESLCNKFILIEK